MESTPPVREGQILDVKIEGVGGKGDGIARHKGFVIFVPHTKTGDEVRIKITKVLPKVSFGEVTQEQKQKPKAPEEPEYDTALDTEDFGED